jgi:hypothetical protein
MTIEEQAEAACNEWCAWVRAQGDDFWKFGDIPDEAVAEWIPGYLRGVQDRVTGVLSEYNPDYEWIWGYGEDLSLFKQSGPPNEMIAKCHAAGYAAGYYSIGGNNG